MLTALSQQDPAWYALLTGHLSPEQGVQVQEMFLIADKRAAARGMVEYRGMHRYVYCRELRVRSMHDGLSESVIVRWLPCQK